jgi:hypothetical protein
MESPAPFASVHRQLITIASAAGGAIPEFQSDSMPVSNAAITIEGLTAAGIGTRKNYLIFRHLERSLPIPSFHRVIKASSTV